MTRKWHKAAKVGGGGAATPPSAAMSRKQTEKRPSRAKNGAAALFLRTAPRPYQHEPIAKEMRKSGLILRALARLK